MRIFLACLHGHRRGRHF